MLNLNTLLLNASIIQSLMTIQDFNHIVDLTFQDLGKGKTINPRKISLDLGETGNYPYYEGFMNAMPAYVGFQDVAGLKWVGGFAGERQQADLPYITAMLTLINPHLGTFLAVMDGAYISKRRTGAQTAMAIQYLLRKKSVTIGIYGVGKQARCAIEAIAQTMTIDTLYIWNHRRSSAEQFKQDMTDIVQGEMIVVDSGKEAAQAEVLITLTPAQEPIIQTDWVQKGTIVMPMGSFQEIEDILILKADKIIVDHIEQALTRGALKHLHNQDQISAADIHSTIGQHAVSKQGLPHIADEIVLCIPIGTGAMDVACGYEIYQRAKDQGLGQTFNFLD